MDSAKALEVPGYQVVQYLGSGARSTVWEIRHTRTDKIYALKRVVKREPSDGRFIEQAVNEYNVGVRFDHEAVRHIFRLRRVKRWLSTREVHVMMEMCVGATVQDERPEDVRETVRIFDAVARGLVHINACGFVHADIKPNNIVVAPAGDVKIIDLGQSCEIGTVKTRIQGTPDFIAPEQVNRQPLDVRTDVFNFGATLYWTLTGRAIPTVMPKKGAVTLKADMQYVPPEEINPDVPSSVSKLIRDCIEYKISRRPMSMNEVLSRLKMIAHTFGPNGNEK